jgi:glucokinase
LGELPVDRWVDADSTATLEGFASGGGITDRYGQGLGAREVLARAATGDARASDIVDSAAAALGAGLAWAVSLVDPELIVLGGGLGSSGGRWLEQVRKRYERLVRPGAPALNVAELGADSGVIGAALAAREAG